FLGESRSPQAAEARESGVLLRVPMTILAALCLAIGLLAPRMLPLLLPALPYGAAFPSPALGAGFVTATAIVTRVTAVSGLFLLLVLAGMTLRRALLSRRVVRRSGTWDCGYALPTPRM